MAHNKRIIRLRVKLVGDQWELLYGGPVKVKNGASGELRLDRVHFTDEKFLKAVTEERRVPVLGVGTELRVALTIKPDLDSGLRTLLLDQHATKRLHSVKLSTGTRFVPVCLAGSHTASQKNGEEVAGLVLQLEGMEPRALESGQVTLPPALGLEPADSLNHAFTRLSEVFEPWRKAHTGSIYERVFYRDRNEVWYPLKDLRNRELVGAGRQVIRDLWANVMEPLGTR